MTTGGAYGSDSVVPYLHIVDQTRELSSMVPAPNSFRNSQWGFECTHPPPLLFRIEQQSIGRTTEQIAEEFVSFVFDAVEDVGDALKGVMGCSA
ncbi:hypothetical protein [Rhodococcus sp. NPDC057529]|uniref:hypothetical protein n=1 Tax=Rhodococcus sp. NPDC057529 TaxID=3346158 RepID=UPI00366C23AD